MSKLEKEASKLEERLFNRREIDRSYFTWGRANDFTLPYLEVGLIVESPLNISMLQSLFTF